MTESNPNMLQSQLEQSTFGIINDAKLLSMAYQEDDDSSGSIMEQDHAAAADYQEMSYAKKTRRHARIQGNDVIVALSEYGKLVFITIIQDALTRRFETLAEVYLDSPGLEYTKKGKKLAIDPCGRAIAIASFQDHFDILILDKTTSRIHFDPIIGVSVCFYMESSDRMANAYMPFVAWIRVWGRHYLADGIFAHRIRCDGQDSAGIDSIQVSKV